MHLVVVGVNHNTAPVEVRERLAIDEGRLADALSALTEHARICEACVLSTCNRTEIYAIAESRADDDALVGFLSDYGRITDGPILTPASIANPATMP